MGMCVRRPLVIASPETDIKTGYKVSLCNDENRRVKFLKRKPCWVGIIIFLYIIFFRNISLK